MSLEVEKFFSISLEMLCIAGIDGYFKKINPAFTKTLGYSEKDLLGKPFVDFVHPDDKEATLAEVSSLALGSSSINFINRYKAKNGKWLWFDWVAVPEGEYIYATARDVTKLRAAEQCLRKSERLASIGTLAAGIAHELKNPIGLMSLQVDNLIEGNSISKGTRDSLIKVRGNIDRSLHIIKNVMRFAREEGSEKQELDVSRLIEGAKELTSSFLQSRKIDLIVEQEPVIKPIYGNAIELEQVLINLIHNAALACEKGGELTMKLQQTEPGLRLTLEDCGSGMSEEEVQRAFDPFFTTRFESGGTGLGLSTCHGIIASHGGKIHIESALGRGTLVSVFLPCPPAEHEFVTGSSS